MSFSRKIESIYCYKEPCVVVSSSKFAPKKIIVYQVPSLDECIGMLPRSIGNYILSFTPFWIEFYLQNIQKKYGNKFLIEMIDKYLCCNNRDPLLIQRCCGRLEFRGRSKMNQEELVHKMIFSIITNYREKKNIPIAFHALLEDKKQAKIQKERILKTLVVGDILYNHTQHIYYLVIQVDEKFYRICIIKYWIFNDEYYVWSNNNKVRTENREKNKLQFIERLSRKVIKSYKTSTDIDFTRPFIDIYYQL
jgi:hypothetical protein